MITGPRGARQFPFSLKLAPRFRHVRFGGIAGTSSRQSLRLRLKGACSRKFLCKRVELPFFEKLWRTTGEGHIENCSLLIELLDGPKALSKEARHTCNLPSDVT
jgi:hypothetical protein